MAGYTPLYETMLTGTLYGKWPHTGIWACLLSRASREGVIDEVPASLAAAIGVPVDLLMQCISDFMQPDPGSRTKDHDGRRLVLIDPNRDWGWKVLNHGKYREKARKKNYDDSRTESGADADRKREDRREDVASREVPTRPAKSRRVPLSEASPSPEDSRRAASGAPGSIDKALFVEAREVFGNSIGGQINRAIRLKGKPWVLGVIEACRGKDAEAARAYLAAGLNGASKPDEAGKRRVVP